MRTAYVCDLCKYITNYVENFSRMEKHTHKGGTYQKSVHVGKYWNHYYIYAGTCDKCYDAITWNEDGGCTADACVDPMCL